MDPLEVKCKALKCVTGEATGKPGEATGRPAGQLRPNTSSPKSAGEGTTERPDSLEGRRHARGIRQGRSPCTQTGWQRRSWPRGSWLTRCPDYAWGL